MDGFFFDPNEIAGKVIVKRVVDENSCTYCGMYRGVQSPMMKPFGDFEANIMIVGEAPGANEDKYGIPFVGKSGDMLKEAFSLYGIDIDKDCVRTNVLQCRPLNNVFDPAKVEFCYNRLERQIDEYKPHLIFAFGQQAARRLIEPVDVNIPGLSGKSEGFNVIHGNVFPIRKYNAWVSLNYHPAYIMREPDMLDVFYDDIKKGLQYLEYEFPKSLVDNTECILCNEEQAIKVLQKRYHYPVSIDFETNGLQPYAPDFHLSVVSIAPRFSKAYIIPLSEPSDQVKAAFIDFLKNNDIICHKYDDSCTRAKLGFGIPRWCWDIMVSKHLLDERRGNKSLEFQVYETTGEEYKHIVDRAEFDKALITNKSNAITYSGLDAIFPQHIKEVHYYQLKEQGLLKGMDFMMEGSKAFAALEQNGVKIDMTEYSRFREEVSVKTKEVNTFFRENDILGKYTKRFGKPLNVQSTADMQRLFFDQLKLKPLSNTDKGNPQVNDALFEVLQTREDAIGELVQNIQLKKSLQKLTGTYLDSIVKYIDVDGFLHAVFNLHIARTLRSSCDSPNLQNVPKRDEYMKNFRKMFIPRYDFFLEADYKGAEVTIQAILAQDKNLLKQINEHFNSHRYWASRLFQVPENQVTKLQRFLAKNKFVFPEFYGSSGKTCAPQLGLPENHVLNVEREFYDDYYGVASWQKEQWAFYQNNGYVIIPTGFRRRGPLTYMQVVNTPIQGTTFHCLLHSLTVILVKEALIKAGLRSLPVLQIHDSMVIDTVKDEKQAVIEIVNSISANMHHWDFYKGAELECEWQQGTNWLEMEDAA